MPIVQLDPGVDVTNCPTCGGPMSAPQYARHSKRWRRGCLDPACGTATYGDVGPIVAVPVQTFRLPGRLSFAERQPGEEG